MQIPFLLELKQILEFPAKVVGLKNYTAHANIIRGKLLHYALHFRLYVAQEQSLKEKLVVCVKLKV